MSLNDPEDGSPLSRADLMPPPLPTDLVPSELERKTDPAPAEGAYQDVVTLVRMEEYRKPYVSIEAMRTLQRLLKTQNSKIGDVKVENLVDSSVVKKIDDSGFFEKLYGEYGVR